MNTKNNNQEQPEIIFCRHDDGVIHPAVARKGNTLLEIPPAIYSVQYSDGSGFFLKPEQNFKSPERIYGNVVKHVDRILKSFEMNDKNLGALLIGVRGSGKTLTLKELMTKGVQMGYPGLLVNQRYQGQEFLNFMAMIKQPVIVGFDELDKVYDGASQEGGHEGAQRVLIQMLDGLVPSNKKLYAFSANSEGRVSEFLKDRPSRVRYTLRFKQLEMSAVTDYVTSNLEAHDEDHIRAFIHLALSDGRFNSKNNHHDQSVTRATTSHGMNFDSMVELVKEMNQFKCDLDEAASLMMDSGSKTNACFNITVFKDGKKLADSVNNVEFDSAYLTKATYDFHVRFYVPNPAPPPTVDEVQEFYRRGHPSTGYSKLISEEVQLDQSHFVNFGSELDALEFARDGYTFILRYSSWDKHLNTTMKLTESVQAAEAGEDATKTVHIRQRGFGGQPGPLF